MDNRSRFSLFLTLLAAFALLSPACSYQGAFVPVSCDSSDECPEGASCTNGHCQIDEPYIDDDTWSGEQDIDEPGAGDDQDTEDGQDSGPGEQDIQEPLECGQGLTACGDECVDLDNDGNHCGQCERKCSDISPYATGQCIDRTCQVDCGEERTQCGELCADLTSDPEHCGACSFICAAGESCLNYECRPTCNPAGAPFGAGNGSVDNPYLICSPTHLQNISSALGKHFILAESIDLSPLGDDFEPIALSKGASFTGTFDGSNLEIRNLTIDNSSSYRSLFGYIGDDGVVKNLTIRQGEVIGGERTAALAGVNKGIIDNCHALEIDIRGAKYTGGLVGENEGQILNSSVAVTVEGSDENVGGLVGRNYGSIESSHFSGSISGTKNNMGGLVGYAEGSSCHISKSSASGEISTGDSISKRIGGLVGTLNGGCRLEQSFAAMSLTAGQSEHVGGLIGRVDGGAVIRNCYSIGSVKGRANVGGLAGRFKSGSFKNCYSLSSVNVSTRANALFGHRDGRPTVENAYWNREISEQSSSGTNVGATRLTKDEFGEPSNFELDFNTNWRLSDDDAEPFKRPILLWEVP